MDDEHDAQGTKDGLSPAKSILLSQRYITAHRAIDEGADGTIGLDGLKRTTSVISPICTNGEGNHCTTDYAEDDNELLQHRSVLAEDGPRHHTSLKTQDKSNDASNGGLGIITTSSQSRSIPHENTQYSPINDDGPSQ